MIKITIKGESPQQIREEAKVVFGLVEPAVLTDEVAAEVGEALANAVADPAAAVQAFAPAEPYPKKRGKARAVDAAPTPAPAAEPAKPSPDNADGLEPPAFLDRRDKKPEPVEGITLEFIRGKLQAILEKHGETGLFKVVNAFKTATGEVARKASQFQVSDYPAVVAKCDEVLAG